MLALFVANVLSQNLRWGVSSPRGSIVLAFELIGFTLVAAAPYMLALSATTTRGRTIAVVSIVTNAIYALGYLALGVYVLRLSTSAAGTRRMEQPSGPRLITPVET